MTRLEIYTKGYCPFCHRAKQLLDAKGVDYVEIDVTYDPELQQEMMTRSNRRTVPQIFIGDQHIGGNDDLVKANRNGTLDRLLENVAKAA